ncbi:prolyl oligopeptidase family serine peptidase [Bosea sp. WAO]|uniref:alpha/beta hydrolase family protein n=1 Tax=Bosea sp. WAO TaxID=406341 RepID=UPI000829C760|nr:prolyl oligopeptidase family serine peptidase [Bosea sp. WAO]
MRRVIAALASAGLAVMLTAAIAAAETVEALQARVGDRQIAVYVRRPTGTGPFPVLVLSHGSPRDAAGRAEFGKGTLAAIARHFTARGVMVAVPIRRGYGAEGGSWAEGYGACDRAEFHQAGLNSARDIRAALDAVLARPDADRRRVVLMGVSAGGWGSLAAASQSVPGLLGVVSFAGGRGSLKAGEVCSPEALVAAAGRYGRGSRVPQLWLYSSNDRFFGPEIAGRLHRAFQEAGGRAEFVAAPPFGEDGHRYIRALEQWRDKVDVFFAAIGFVGRR